MKNKCHYCFNEEEKSHFVREVIQKIKEHYQLENYDALLIPDTKNECFKDIVAQLNLPTVVLKKNTKEQVMEQLEKQKMMKAERKKLVDNLQQMEDIKIGLVAANQRMRIANLLFNIQEDLTDKKVLFMDDSIFTGSTFKAISQTVNIQEAFVLFSNQD